MNAETIGLLSGILVIISAIPYGLRINQRKIEPNLTSWSLWSIIGLALLLTYKSSGAKANVWPAVFGFINPAIITILVMRQHGGWKKLDKVETTCLIFGLLSLISWLLVRENKAISQYALYLAIIADACAAIPTIKLVWTHPNEDRPFAWFCFAVGYGLAIFAITEKTIANYILPLYMFCGALSITLPLIRYRWQKRLPLSEWI